MDSYPIELQPRRLNAHDQEPFREWWDRAKQLYPMVPGEVAEHWVYRNWGGSPFGWLPSIEYEFAEVSWPTTLFLTVRTEIDNFKPERREAISWGRTQFLDRTYEEPLVSYIRQTGSLPTPPIVLDNRDGHLANYPSAHLLIEGHRRYSLVAYLHRNGLFADTLPVWLMTHLHSKGEQDQADGR